MLLFETKMSLGWMAEKFPTLNGTKNVSTVPTTEGLRILPPAKSIQSMSHPIAVKTFNIKEKVPQIRTSIRIFINSMSLRRHVFEPRPVYGGGEGSCGGCW
jgi:hypothetical protein